MCELRDGEIGSERGLSAFLTHDTNTNISSLDHAHVVASITYASNALFGKCTDQKSDASLLGG